ncbi:hypothetical protein JKP88DRAFT_269267 [Tribonema minus]|uniref:Uncharacterized protein n=1 Tax=Tribonema minus TaxID=303371 RepID=A0A835ZE35_9STRA|nr:hypothetical protein JKP88DRAFT_269267 [Tribonema minus]
MSEPETESEGEPDSEDESQGSEGDAEDTGLTENQNRLLYMISLYTRRSDTKMETESWLRKPALVVLLYEGIVANVLDFDYAPQSELIENRRVWMNVSQEGKSDVEFLREEELVNGLHVSSRSYKPITCYQVSAKGKELVKRIGRKEKEAVHEFVYARGTRELLHVRWDGNEYWLESASGYRRKSSITETEDVSYVSSAYVPQCLRYGGRPTLSNAHRAHESGVNTDNIRDELDEVITLNSVSIIVAEYIPFGANQIVQLNNSVGSTERCQGGFISPAIDDDSTGTGLEMNPELTSVDILDYTLTNHINFEAEINFAVDSGIVQVETFGVSLNAEGTCFYGMQVEAVMDRIKDNISLDHLARLLVDVQQDSSSIVDSIISQHQRELLNLMFLGDAPNRNKVNLIIAIEITPHLTAEEYMDKGEYENELKQVIGDTKAAYDISEHDTLVFGGHGLLVAGPNSRHHEPLLCAYLQFITIDIFLQNYFSRLWILTDDMKVTYDIIVNSDSDPTSLDRIRYRICALSNDIILMEEILGYVLEALDVIEVPPEPPEQAGRSLYERLEISGMRSQLLRRSADLKKNIGGAQKYLDVLREMSAVVSENKLFRLNESLELNTKRLCQLNESNQKSAKALQIILYVLAGSLSFDILDRITGDWTVTNTTWLNGFMNAFILNSPGLWFFVSMFVWGGVAFLLWRLFHWGYHNEQGLTTVRTRFHRKVFLDRLTEWLGSKIISYEERNYDLTNDLVRITFEERDKRDWGGYKPRLVVEFDERTSYLLTMDIVYNRRLANRNMAFNHRELREKVVSELDQAQVWDSIGEDHSNQDLAADKRAAIEARLELEERAAATAATAGGGGGRPASATGAIGNGTLK